MAAIDAARSTSCPSHARGRALDRRCGESARALGRGGAQLALAREGRRPQTKSEQARPRRRRVCHEARSREWRAPRALPEGLAKSLDVCCVLLHGPRRGRETVQGLFELAGCRTRRGCPRLGYRNGQRGGDEGRLRATGCRCGASAGKEQRRAREPGAVEEAGLAQLGFPCFVKPANLGWLESRRKTQ